jgi:hypothetical protein
MTADGIEHQAKCTAFLCALMLSFMTLVACENLPDGSAAMVEDSADIIGGYKATSASLNHTGAIILDYWDSLEPFCTGTLIGPKVVVTAKHCAEVASWGEDMYFGVGPDAYLPDELIPIIALEMAPSDEGGFTGYGQDVAVLYLDHAPFGDIVPVTPSPSSELSVDDRMVSIGYGVFTARDAYDGQRRIGRETVLGTEGLTFEAMLGDFESFVEWWINWEVTDANILEDIDDDELIAYVQEIYESEVLLEGDEVVTGGGEGNTQSCFGDSGGPLMKYVSGSGWQTYGVVSGGIDSLHSVCDFGTVFATFGPEVMAFLQAAQAYEDPCGEVGQGGMCDGNVAVNCVSDLAEGIRTLDEQDCDDTGQTCVVLPDGARCGIDPTPDPDEEDPPPAAPIGMSIDEAMRNAFLYQR